MRTLEHRRHSRRELGGTHLSPEGLELAHRVAAEIGAFDRVFASPIPRALETAHALGFADPTVVGGLAEGPDPTELPRSANEIHGFEEYARLYREVPAAREYGRLQLALWEEHLKSVPEGGRVLMVSHGGLIELGAMAALPQEAARWGASLSYLEGVRLVWDDGRWVRGQVLRVGTR